MGTFFCMCLLAYVLPRPVPPMPGNTDPVVQLTYERDCLELDLRDANAKLLDERSNRNWHVLKTATLAVLWIGGVIFGTWAMFLYATAP